MFSSPWRQKTAFSAVLLFGVRTEPKCTKTDFKDWVGPNMRPYAQCKLKRPSASLQHSKRLSKPTSRIPKWTESENSGNAIHPNCDKRGTNTHSTFARSTLNIGVNKKHFFPHDSWAVLFFFETLKYDHIGTERSDLKGSGFGAYVQPMFCPLDLFWAGAMLGLC